MIRVVNGRRRRAALDRRQALLLLEVAERIDFDPVFRQQVLGAPVASLVGAGVRREVAEELATGEEEELAFFADDARRVAARAHLRAVAALSSYVLPTGS